MPDLNDFHAFKSTSSNSSSGNGCGGFFTSGIGWVILIVILVIVAKLIGLD